MRRVLVEVGCLAVQWDGFWVEWDDFGVKWDGFSGETLGRGDVLLVCNSACGTITFKMSSNQLHQ